MEILMYLVGRSTKDCSGCARNHAKVLMEHLNCSPVKDSHVRKDIIQYCIMCYSFYCRAGQIHVTLRNSLLDDEVCKDVAYGEIE